VVIATARRSLRSAEEKCGLPVIIRTIVSDKVLTYRPCAGTAVCGIACAADSIRVRKTHSHA